MTTTNNAPNGKYLQCRERKCLCNYNVVVFFIIIIFFRPGKIIQIIFNRELNAKWCQLKKIYETYDYSLMDCCFYLLDRRLIFSVMYMKNGIDRLMKLIYVMHRWLMIFKKITHTQTHMDIGHWTLNTMVND